jgi:exodeoxyribonuclease-3
MVDSWRALHPEQVAYTWWDYKTRARDRDVGWRIDYFFHSRDLTPVSCEILTAVPGSDHAPLALTLVE